MATKPKAPPPGLVPEIQKAIGHLFNAQFRNHTTTSNSAGQVVFTAVTLDGKHDIELAIRPHRDKLHYTQQKIVRRIVELRDQGLSQAETAESLGVSQSRVSQLERVHAPRESLYRKAKENRRRLFQQIQAKSLGSTSRKRPKA